MRWTGQEWHSLVEPRESCLWCNCTPREFRQISRGDFVEKQALPFILHTNLTLPRPRQNPQLVPATYFSLILYNRLCMQMNDGSPCYLWPAFFSSLLIFSCFCFQSRQTSHVAAFRLTFGDITDRIFKVRPTAAPWHVFQVEALIWAQHDHLDGARLEQSDLVLCRQLPGKEQSVAVWSINVLN